MYFIYWIFSIWALTCLEIVSVLASQSYHIQTDEGPDRFFKYKTENGQFRKERRLEDGTVIGTEAWIDAAGFLRQSDYIADKQGYRILKQKVVYVGTDANVEDAIKSKKKITAQADPSANVKHIAEYALESTSKPLEISADNPTTTSYGYSTPEPFEGQSTNDVSVSATGYILPNQYHVEHVVNDTEKIGSFGYVDSFGIRRVVYYAAGAEGGFKVRKNNRYVGPGSKPYDEPRPAIV